MATMESTDSAALGGEIPHQAPLGNRIDDLAAPSDLAATIEAALAEASRIQSMLAEAASVRPSPGKPAFDWFEAAVTPTPRRPGSIGKDSPVRRAGTSAQPNHQRVLPLTLLREARADPPGTPASRWPSTARQATERTAAPSARPLPSPAVRGLPQTSSRGWRKLVYQATAGTVNPGPSPDELHYQRLSDRIRTPLPDCHRVAVLSLKGGVGKTTTTVAVGSTLASLRGDRVVAIDANPDLGTLASKVPGTSTHTIRELLQDASRLSRYVDLRRYLSQADSRLEVLASANDPEPSASFGEYEYRIVDGLLQRHFSILLADCGTGIRHSAMRGVLDLADTLVIVTSATADGRSSASATLDWLTAQGYADLVREAVTVISAIPAQVDRAELDAIAVQLESRTRRVVRVPFDPHLADGDRVVLSQLKRETRAAYREIAGAIAELFGQEDRGTSSRPRASRIA